MRFSAEQIAKIRALTPAQIGTLIAQSGKELGMSEQKAKAFARHSGTLHKKLQKMTDEQLQRFASLLGETQVKDLLSKLE